MKKTLFVLAALAAVLVGFGACSNGSSDDNTPTVVQQSDLYGSYWGSLEVAGAKFDMCMEIKKDFAGIHLSLIHI